MTTKPVRPLQWPTSKRRLGDNSAESSKLMNNGDYVLPPSGYQYDEGNRNLKWSLGQWAISQKMGHRHNFFIVTELLHVAYQKIATYK